MAQDMLIGDYKFVVIHYLEYGERDLPNNHEGISNIFISRAMHIVN